MSVVYDACSASLDVVLGSRDEIAAERGRSSAEVVLHSHLSDARTRQLRRTHTAERLAEASEGDDEYSGDG